MSRNKIDELLRERHQRFTPLQRLIRQAANQDAWTAQLRAILPQPLANDCEVAGINGSTIVVTCRNAASATKMRFLAPELLVILQDLSSFQAAREIQIRVSANR